MYATEVMLPGGLPGNGNVERHARFRPLTGRLQQALIEFDMRLGRPGYVTSVLCSAVDSIGSRPADAGRVADLCVADRQYLMLRLAAMLDGEQMWLNVGCSHCDASFDVDIRRCDLPVKEAGPDFPVARLRVKDRAIEVRVPTGADQERIAIQSEEEAIRQFLQDCIRAVNGKPPGKKFLNSLSQTDIEAIDEALDETSPAVCDRLLVNCPECGCQQYAELDHYVLTGMNERYFYDEVHTLASHYHWSEAAILDLPQARRRLYLGMINRSAGMTEQGRTA